MDMCTHKNVLGTNIFQTMVVTINTVNNVTPKGVMQWGATVAPKCYHSTMGVHTACKVG